MNKSINALQFVLLVSVVAIIVVVGCYERCFIASSAYARYLLCINNVGDNIIFTLWMWHRFILCVFYPRLYNQLRLNINPIYLISYNFKHRKIMEIIYEINNYFRMNFSTIYTNILQHLSTSSTPSFNIHFEMGNYFQSNKHTHTHTSFRGSCIFVSDFAILPSHLYKLCAMHFQLKMWKR